MKLGLVEAIRNRFLKLPVFFGALQIVKEIWEIFFQPSTIMLSTFYSSGSKLIMMINFKQPLSRIIIGLNLT